MDQIIADICHESSLVDKRLHEQSQLVIKQLKEGGADLDLLEETKLVLRLAKSCIEWSGVTDKKNDGKVPNLGTKLLGFYIRHLAGVTALETFVSYDKLIQQIIDTIESIVVQPEHIVRPEVLAVLVDLTTSFAGHMTLQHVIGIIHLCALEVRNYYRGLVGTNKHSSSSSLSSLTSLAHLKLFSFEWQLSKSVLANTKKSMARKLNMTMSSTDLGDDKTLATICLIAGQVCHFFVKQNICHSSSSRLSTNSSSTSGSTQPHHSNTTVAQHQQDLTHLLLYLSKKLETRLSLYYETSKQYQQQQDSLQHEPQTCPRVELFTQLKILNCYHLKCLHYTLLTIPDAWRAMTSNIMDVVSRNLAPPLVALITPKTVKPVDGATVASGPSNEHAGRGAQSVLGLCFEDDLSEQERQLVYKISAELMRLFGLEETMRPLLEALFYRMFLLPPLSQRTQAFVYMQDMLKNSLLVTLLISDPICLFGRSHSRSSPFGLLQLVLDAIKEALVESSHNSVTAQQALICWATLLTSLQNILVTADKGGTLLSSPSVSKLLAHVNRDIEKYQHLIPLPNEQTERLNTISPALRADDSDKIKIGDIQDRIYGETRQQKRCERVIDEVSSYHQCLFALVKQTSSGESNEFAGQTYLNSQRRRAYSADNLTESSNDYLSGIKTITKCYSQECVIWKKEKFVTGHIDLPIANEYSSEDEDTSVFESVSDDQQQFPIRIDGQFSEMTEDVEDSEEEDFQDFDDEPIIDTKDEVLFRKAPKTIFGDLCATNHDLASVAHLERSIGRIFSRHLQAKQEDWANTSKTMTIVRLDEEIQRFASEFCNLLYQKLRNFQENEKEELLGLNRTERQMFVRHRKLFEDLFINADGIYLTAYQVFSFSFRLYQSGYYLRRERSKIKTSEVKFIEAVLNYGSNIYLSQAFLAEVYQQVLIINFIQPYLEGKTMLQLLEDIEPIDAHHSLSVGALSDYARLQKIAGSISRSISDVSIVSLETIDERENFSCSEVSDKQLKPNELQRQCLRLLVRRACHHFWTTFLASIEMRLGAKSKDTFAKLVDTIDNVTYTASSMKVLGVRNRKQLAQLTLFDECIELLGQLLRLSLRVDYFDRMDTLYELFLHFLLRLAPNDKSFPLSSSASSTLPPSTVLTSTTRIFLRLTPAQVDVVKTFLVFASKVGAQQANVWPIYFELTRFLNQHETLLFRSTRSNLFSRARVSINSMLRSNSFTTGLGGASSSTPLNRTSKMSSSSNFESMYDFSTLPGVHEAQSQSLETEFDQLVTSWRQQQSSNSVGGQRLLDEHEMEIVLEYLNNFALITFENVAVHYSLESMLTFIQHLIDYSAAQLTELRDKAKSNTLANTTSLMLDTKTVAFTRLIEVVLRFVRTGRPLIHFLRLWPQVANHLVFVISVALDEPALMKRTLSAMHDIINAALTMYTELDFFHFNEMIFALYERLMWWETVANETSDNDRLISSMLSMQEMLLNSICEFAEGANAEIRSGWRSIFRSLRGFKFALPPEQQNFSTFAVADLNRTKSDKNHENETNQHGCSPRMDLLSDILNAYLAGTNSHAFAHASVDYIQCLLHLMKTNTVGMTLNEETRPHDKLDALLVVFLKYLQRFAKLLRERSRRPVFGEANFNMAPNVRRRRVRWIDVDRLREALVRDLNNDQHCQFSFNVNLPFLEEAIEASNTDTARLWALMLDEFAGTILASQVEHRQMQLEVFMALLEMTPDIIDAGHNQHHFTIQCYNQIVLPLMQDFLRQSLRPIESTTILSSKTHLEQLYSFYNTWLKIFNEKIINLILEVYEHEITMNSSLNVLFKQTLLVYLECFTPDYNELVKVVAMSSLRILLTSLSLTLTTNSRWEVLIDCFKLGHYLTLCPLRRLLDCLEGVPFNFGAEFSRIKILTTRSDRTATESMRRLARRVFMVYIDNKNNQINNEDIEKTRLATKPARLEDNRIYTIIIETDSGVKKSFHCNELVAQLYLHLAWLQTFGGTLTSDLKCRLEDIIGFFGGYHNTTFEDHDSQELSSSSTKTFTQPRLSLLTLDQFDQITSLFSDSFQVACQFDRRTGLKFLLQYVAETSQPANLYYMTTLAWACRFCLAYQLYSIQIDHLHQSEDSIEAKTCSLETVINEMITFYAQHHARLDVEQMVRARLKAHRNCPLPSELFILIAMGKESTQQILTEVEKDEHNRNSSQWQTQLEDCSMSQLIPSGLMTTDFRMAKQKLLKTPKQKTEAGVTNNNNNIIFKTSNNPASEYFQLDELLCLRLLNEIISCCVRAHLQTDDELFKRSCHQFQKLVNFSIEHPLPVIDSGETEEHDSKDPRIKSIRLWIDRLVGMLTKNNT